MPSDSPRSTPLAEIHEDDVDDIEELADFCITCLEIFRYDDCGGYNPPCECGFHCRHCHERETLRNSDEDGDDDYDYRDYFNG